MTLTLNHRIASTTTLLIADFMWIGLFMSPRYGTMIKNIQNKPMKVNLISAFLSYFLMVVGLNMFVLPLLDLDNINVKNCLMTGFLFGIIVYGVYDFTCGAVLQDWDFKLALFDILWGGFVYFISCYLLKYIEKTK